MEKQQINLARKWRSKTFKTVVGQDLALRILQNSLYVNQFFPVYLFSGQKGCGKTTTARVFATALNCEKLSEFQKNPKVQMPCLECASCSAMKKNQHPDFIEIDAASYTGIDNIRTIIDSSSFLPVLGSKKVYLIDEAHMLSKSAFNAFLKLLEEPPEFVVFILATTDPQKIIDTVVSRCFQIFFDPIDQEKTVKHLSHICETEKILYEQDALQLIAKETGGSLRDALNLLEQVRFAGAKVNVDAVRSVLGHVPEFVIIDIIQSLCSQDPQKLLGLIEQIAQKAYGAEYIWQQLIACVYDLLLLHHGMESKTFSNELLHTVKESSSIDYVIFLFEALCEYEQQVAQYTRKDIVLELMLMRLLYRKSVSLSGGAGNLLQDEKAAVKKKPFLKEWEMFVSKMSEHSDVVIVSLFKEAEYRFDPEQKDNFTISFLKKFEFFVDVLEHTSSQWKPLFYAYFPNSMQLNYVFDRVAGKEKEIQKKDTADRTVISTPQNIQKVSVHENVQKVSPNKVYASKNYTTKTRGRSIDVSDAEIWKTASALQKVFEGTFIDITEEKT